MKNKMINKTIKRDIKEVELNNINLNEYIILDVRSRREFKENHINGAINVPIYDIRINLEKKIKDKNSKILICCQSGVRSKKALQIAKELGYQEVYNLKGGLENI